MMKKNYLNSLIYLAIIIILLGIFQLNSQGTCITSEPGDSPSFGDPITFNDDYIVIGDPKANRVVIYTRHDKDKWIRTRVIRPPKGSRTERIGEGFGSSLALEQATLVIGAYIRKEKPTNLDAFQSTSLLGVSYAGGLYKVQLDQLNPEVESIDALVPLQEGEISGLSFFISRGNIAFDTEREEDGRRIIKVYLISDGEVKEILPPADSGKQIFGIALELKNNRLLVGSLFINNTGGGWLFDLNNLAHPEKLVVNNAYLGNVLALSDEFAVIGASGGAIPESKTLIKSLKDGSITIIDGEGLVSLNGNILARMRYASPDGEQEALLEVFDLSDIKAPRLVRRSFNNVFNNLEDDFYQLANGFLVTEKETASGIKLCIKQKSK